MMCGPGIQIEINAGLAVRHFIRAWNVKRARRDSGGGYEISEISNSPK